MKVLKINKEEKKLILYIFLIGVVTHGFMIFNKYSLNDDNDSIFRLGITYSQGRWLLGKFDDIAYELGTYNFSMPGFNGVITILLIAFASCFTCKILKIKSFKLQLLLGASMITVVEVASLLGFMFTSWCYALALLLAILAAVICIDVIDNNGKWYWIIPGSFFLCCSLGIYQAYLSVFFCIILINMLIKYNCIEVTFINFFKEAIAYCICTIVGVVGYFLINKLVLFEKNIQMTTYQNMDSWGIVNLAQYKERIITVYKAFICPQNYRVTIYPELLGKIYPIILVVLLMGYILLIVNLLKEKLKKSNIVITFIIIAILPLAINFHYILSELNVIHGLMIYSSVFTYVLIIAIFQRVLDSNVLISVKKIFVNIAVCIVLVACILNARVDNFLYLKAYTIHENHTTYLTALITRIISTEGYNQNMPLYLYNINKIEAGSFNYDGRFDTISYLPFNNQLVQSQEVMFYMNTWCGYYPTLVNDPNGKFDSVLAEMECYPNDNSIRIVDDIIIVKFSN